MRTSDLPEIFVAGALRLRDGRLNAYESLDPRTTALVVIDMQEYFLQPGMPGHITGGEDLLPGINELARALRAKDGKVIWVKTVAPDDPADWSNRREATTDDRWSARQTLLAADGAGYPLHRGCEVETADLVVTKTRYSALTPHPSALHEALTEGGIETVLITGVATSTCCESTAREASMWGWRTIMVSDGSRDATTIQHEHALGKFLTLFGDVRPVTELIEMIDARGV